MWKCTLMIMAVSTLLLSSMAQAAPINDVTAPGDTVQGVPNDSDWPGGETPPMAIDDNTSTKYLHFKGYSQPTGFKVTPSESQSVVTGLTFTTANDAPERDPVSFEFYGSNVSIDGPYTLIASGDIVDFSQATAWSRLTINATPISFDNDVAYDHYQILFPAVRDPGAANSMQIAEVELLRTTLKAFNPTPANGTIVRETWVGMAWTPGEFAASHDVYLGENYDDVAAGTGDTFQGNQALTSFAVGFPGFPYPDGVLPGTTYYWRIDDVEADGTTTHKGVVWSFSIAPKSAYGPDPVDGSEAVDPNVALSWELGLGAILHYFYFGDDYDVVSNATVGEGMAWGAPTYSPGTLDLEKAYYWRVDAFHGFETIKGDVWSFSTYGAVGSPVPSNGAANVTQVLSLSWSPSDSAASHQVYFGTDKDAVINADTSSPQYKGSKNLGSESHDPGKLEWDTTYYWRVDEVEAGGATQKGMLWSFTTADFLVVDDFESYNDIEEGQAGSNLIYLAWVDGYDDPTNGSQTGYLDIPSYEDTIVHSGNKSMPLIYDNAVGKSEATLTLTYPRDWTEKSVDTLTIWFTGEATNAAETMYVTLNNSATVDHDDPQAALISEWTQWNIDLQTFADQGVNLTNVDSITLGLRSVTGGSGMMYFDDIRLYPPAP